MRTPAVGSGRAIAALAIVILLAGCGGSSSTHRPTATATATATSAPTRTATSASTATASGTATLTATPPPTASASATPTATATIDTSAEPRFAAPGPYPVGYTTIDLADRQAAVFYPALPGSQVGKPLATYDQTDPLPESLASLFKAYDLTFTMSAYNDLPAATDGPFPLLLFSHGFGGWRLANSRLLAGIASWGFVVAAPDHLERGLFAVATNTAMPSTEKDIEVLLATRDAVGAPTGTAAALLTGLADIGRTAVSGHSAGGGAALAMLDQPIVTAVVGYAAAGTPATLEHGKPTLLIAGSDDLVVPPATNDMLYDEVLPPRRALEIDRAGHNSYTDSCIAIRTGTDLVAIVKMIGLPIPPDLLVLATNGCGPDNLDPVVVQSVVQHFTVAHLRAAFGLDVPAVGLGDGIATAFDGVTLTYRFEN
jgi:dienelactone hydrolase